VSRNREGSNRTIVGLKHIERALSQKVEVGQQSHHCGIETTEKVRTRTKGSGQQSHHCGIETASSVSLKVCQCSNRTIVGLKPVDCSPPNLLRCWQQSHHCGIETPLPHILSLSLAGSNRTIVGLKHAIAFASCASSERQQSHHCGIETGQRQKALDERVSAAIAPLWD